MKKTILVLLLSLFTITINAQWTSSGDNTTTGKVGIGTTDPKAKLHVNNGDNSYGAILANATEDKFSLYTKTFDTNVSNIESFRLGLKYDTNENNGFISFHRGSGAGDGFLGFSTSGEERIRIEKDGNVGIGITNPYAKLHVFDEVNGAFNGIIIDNKKTYGVNSGINQTSRMALSLSENNHNALNRIFGLIEAGTISETTSVNGRLSFYVRNNGTPDEKMRINHNGNVGIGTNNPGSWKLAVLGRVRATEIKVEAAPWPDYVFSKKYNLPTLQEVEKHIKEKGHLKNIPSAKEVAKKGIFLGEMNAKLLQKIEELTLYTIQQQSEIKELKKENKEIKNLLKRVSRIEEKLKKKD